MKLMAAKADSNKKDVQLASKLESNCVLLDRIKETIPTYHIILVDKQLTSKENAQSPVLYRLRKDLDTYLDSYIILNATDLDWKDDDLKGESATGFFTKHESNWRSYRKYKGCEAISILAFGGALYGLNGSADVIASDFYDDDFGLPSYFYSGHAYKPCDLPVFPADYIDDVYPNDQDYVNYKTRFARAQMEKMSKRLWSYWKPDIMDEPIHIRCKTKEEVSQVLEDHMGSELMSFDTETSGLKFYDLKIKCITVCFDGIHGYYLPFELVDLEQFARLFISCKRTVGANPKYDIHVLWMHGLSQFCMCTDAQDELAHSLHSGRKQGLKPSSYYFTNMGGYDNELQVFKKQTKLKNYFDFPNEKLCPYAINDAIATWRSFKECLKLANQIDAECPNEKYPDWTLIRWYNERVMPIYRVVVKAEYDGVNVDSDRMERNRKSLEEAMKEMRPKINQMFNDLAAKCSHTRYEDTYNCWSDQMNKLPSDFAEINVFSSTQLGAWLYKYTSIDAPSGYAKGHEEKTKMPSIIIDGPAQSVLLENGYSMFENLKEYKNCHTVLNGFLGQDKGDGESTGWKNFSSDHEGTSKVYQSYKVMGTETFRFIGFDPNFQNIPTRGKWAKYIKNCVDTPWADLYTITTPAGEYKLAEFEKIKTARGWVEAQNLTEEDEIILNEGKPEVKLFQFDLTPNGWSKVPADYNSWFSLPSR